MIWLQVIGWIGTAMIIIAFAFKRKLAPAHAALINIVGASLLGASQVADKAWPGVALEVVWVGVAMWDLFAAFRGGDAPSSP